MKRATRIRTAEHRKHIPIGVKLHACLLLLGYTNEQIVDGQIEFDHYPALGLRVVDEATGQLVPAPNDPNFIRPMLNPEHKVKTHGPGGEKRITSRGGDRHAMAVIVRLSNDHADFLERREVTAEPRPPQQHERRKQSRAMPGSRESKFKRKMNGKVVLR